MWEKFCDKLVDQERLEEQYVQYFGEKYRAQIHEKLQKTVVGFFVDNINNLDGFTLQINRFLLKQIFPEATQDLFGSSGISLFDSFKDLVRDFKQNPISLLNYDISILGYKFEDIVQIIENNQWIPGPKYEEFQSKLLRAKETLDLENYESSSYKSPKMRFKELQLDAESSIDSTHLNDVIKNESSFDILVKGNPINWWIENLNLGIEAYLSIFNEAFGTRFNSFEELQNDEYFYNISLITQDLGREFRKNSSAFKANELVYIPNDNISQARRNNFHKKKKHLGLSLGEAWTHREKLLGIKQEDVKYNVIVKLNCLTSYSAIIHEIIHILQTGNLLVEGLPFETSGFQNSSSGGAFNEIVTDFLAVRMTQQILPEGTNFPINKILKSLYSEAFCVMEDFLYATEDLLKDCQFSQDAPKMLKNQIGEENYKKITSLSLDFLIYGIKDMATCINKELNLNDNNGYRYVKDILADIDMLSEKLKDNKKIMKFLNLVKELNTLSRNIAQEYTVRHNQGVENNTINR